MPHAPDWHLLDNRFPDADSGIPIPVRNTSAGGATLQISNLDRTDPPGYRAGGVPRATPFNGNVYRLSAAPCMPAIPVVCSVSGFDPAVTPIEWRIICRHVLSRHMNAGGFQYKGSSESLEREWRGESRGASFTLFGAASPECSCTYSDESHVLGGHALLLVGARVNGVTLLDYVHLRIGGTNPSADDVFGYVDKQLAGYDPNIVTMLRAIYAHESGFQQFAAREQKQTAMTFDKRFHKEAGQADCRVIFNWPDDPENFPLASFDFGVGISQFTKVGDQKVTCEIAWDWRENIRVSANLFLKKLQASFQPGLTWQNWALRSWAAYNGSGAAAAAYAQKLVLSPEGSKVSTESVDGGPQIALIRPPASLPDPGVWLA